MKKKLHKKIKKIKLLLTDNDGVLTDSGVYYSAKGEELKRYSIRDGMGVERLRNLVGVETGIVTGENSMAVKRRAEKLQITEVHLGIKDKPAVLKEIIERKNISAENIAYIGDDVNDLDVLGMAGLSACPADALPFIVKAVDYVCNAKAGHGAFREFAELVIAGKNKKSGKKIR